LPSEKVLGQKQKVVDDLTEMLNSSLAGVLVSYKGINVTDDTKLRRELRESGVRYSVVKNTLLSRAAENAGLDSLKGVLSGTTAIALADDYTSAARILVAYSEKNKNFEIKNGFIDKDVIDATQVVALSKLPSREELVAKVLGGLNAPITGFVNVLNANLRGLVCALNAIAEKKSA